MKSYKASHNLKKKRRKKVLSEVGVYFLKVTNTVVLVEINDIGKHKRYN